MDSRWWHEGKSFATLPPTIRLTTASFGRPLGPLVFEWMFVAHQVGAAVAAYGAGLTRTVEGTYAPTFLTPGMLCVVAGIGRSALSETGRRPSRRRRRHDAGLPPAAGTPLSHCGFSSTAACP
jgi:hypothetical protein